MESEIKKIRNFITKNPLLSALIISFFVFLLLFIFYSNLEFSIKGINRSAGIIGLALVSLSLLHGPISRLFPQFSFLIVLRKPIGLIGFFFILIHWFISFFFIFDANIANIINSPKKLALIFGAIAFFIFFLMAITSTKKAVEILTYDRWKLLHRFGYIAILLASLHFIFMKSNEIGLFIKPIGYLVLFIAFIALSLRMYELLKKGKNKK